MLRTLTRLRSVTARRQLRWIVWGMSVGALPFVTLYLMPFLFGWSLSFSEYTAVLLGCIPLAFASAIVRYRLMDIEVIIKKALVVSTVVIVLIVDLRADAAVCVSYLPGADQNRSQFWAMLATLIVALVAPVAEECDPGRARSALLPRSLRLPARAHEFRARSEQRSRSRSTDVAARGARVRNAGRRRMALFMLDPRAEARRFTADRVERVHVGCAGDRRRRLTLGARLTDGLPVVIDDPLPMRRLLRRRVGGLARGRAVLLRAVRLEGRDDRGRLRPAAVRMASRSTAKTWCSSDAVAGQAATAIENARLYGQLQGKAEEIERLRQFSDSVVESLSDGLVVVDLEDRVLRWNRRVGNAVRRRASSGDRTAGSRAVQPALRRYARGGAA